MAKLANENRLQVSLLAAWVRFLDRVEMATPGTRPEYLHDAAAGKLTGTALDCAAKKMQKAFADLSAKRGAEPPEKRALAASLLLSFQAGDPQLITDSAGQVMIWPNRASPLADAKAPSQASGPFKASAAINGHTKSVLRFDGRSLLEAPGHIPPSGNLFVVYRTDEKGNSGQRLIGWEDSDVGKHGLGLIPAPDGRLHVVLRNNGQSGDIVNANKTGGFEIACVSWGARGALLHRNGVAAGVQKGIVGLSSDPAIASLRIGGPGSGSAPRFRGDVAELRVYDRQLSDAERQAVETELRVAWFKQSAPASPAPRDLVADLYDELLSPRGPLWLSVDERMKCLAPEIRIRLTKQSQELADLKKKTPLTNEEAVAVQDGGPKGTRHEGFQDAHIFIRGDHKRLGPKVPRGFPRVLTGGRREQITMGSGRLQLADWLARATTR